MTRTKARRLAGPMAAALVRSGLIKPEAERFAFETIARALFEKTQTPVVENTNSHGRTHDEFPTVEVAA